MTKMRVSIMESIPMKDTVQIMDDHQIADLLTGLSKYASWSKLAQIYGIPKGTLNGYANGRKIKNPNHRRIFGMSVLAEIELCPNCGKPVHNEKCKTAARKKTDTSIEARRQRAIERIRSAARYAARVGVNPHEVMREVA